MPAKKIYLGDAVYAELDEFGSIVLTTENGVTTTNRIVLEPYVHQQLEEWVAAWREEITRSGSAS